MCFLTYLKICNIFQAQFNFACIVIHPLEHNSNRVVVKIKEDLESLIGQNDPHIISDQNVAVLARQLAIHANVSIGIV